MIDGSKYKPLEWVESNLRREMADLSQKMDITSNQTLVATLLSFCLSTLAIIVAVLCASQRSCSWIIVAILGIVICLAYYGIYCLIRKNNENNNKSTRSIQSYITNVNVCVTDKVFLCQWYMQMYNEIGAGVDAEKEQEVKNAVAETQERQRVHIYFEIVTYIGKSLDLLLRIFKNEYTEKVFDVGYNRSDLVKVYQLEEDMEQISEAVAFLCDCYNEIIHTPMTTNSKKALYRALFGCGKYVATYNCIMGKYIMCLEMIRKDISLNFMVRSEAIRQFDQHDIPQFEEQTDN